MGGRERVLTEDEPEEPAPKTSKPTKIERQEIEQRSDSDQVQMFAESFFYLDEYGVNAQNFMAEAAAVLRAAEMIDGKVARIMGDILDEAAESIREQDPSLHTTGVGKNLNIAIHDVDDDVFGILDVLGEDEDLVEDDDILSDREKERLKEAEDAERLRPTPDAGTVTGRNYTLDPESMVQPASPVVRAENNIAAIRLVKRLVQEGRYATRGEQAVLARFVGWGGIKAIFAQCPKVQFVELQAELKELLTKEGYETAIRYRPHIHRATEAAFLAGRRPEREAEETTRYHTLEGALACLTEDYGLSGIDAKLDEPSLFDGHQS